MKQVFIFLAVGLFFSFLTIFVVNSFSPFDDHKVQELISSSEILSNNPEKLDEEISFIVAQGLILDYLSTNAYLAFLLVAAALTSFIASIHLLIDKVFFKSIWESPSLLNAVRRSLLVTMSSSIIIYMKFLKVETITLLLIPASAIVTEIIFISLKNDINKLKSMFTKKESLKTN